MRVIILLHFGLLTHSADCKLNLQGLHAGLWNMNDHIARTVPTTSMAFNIADF